MSMIMHFGPRAMDLSVPRVMGVLNVTPDSFSDGGALYENGSLNMSDALRGAEQMLADGADFIDIGGESTRPGAAEVSLQEEMDRVLPVVEGLNRSLDVVISIDTSSPELMREAAALGAGLINDVRALARPSAIEAVADLQLPVCLMHMQGKPKTMQDHVMYQESVIATVKEFLLERIQKCVEHGIKRENIIVDPGLGFGKTDEHNFDLIRSLKMFESLACPVLVGASRKSTIGRFLDRDIDQRLAGSLALAYASLLGGAKILRVHDVAETVDIVKIFKKIHMSCSA